MSPPAVISKSTPFRHSYKITITVECDGYRFIIKWMTANLPIAESLAAIAISDAVASAEEAIVHSSLLHATKNKVPASSP